MSEHPDKAPGQPAGETSEEAGTGEPGLSEETVSLLNLIDRLGALLERSDLIELEVEAGETGIVLRKPVATAASGPATVGTGGAGAGTDPAGGVATGAVTGPAQVSAAKVVKAPLTGIFYGAPSPGSPPYVAVGQHITVGQVIGLIEAMKLFNEIKSDQAGTVVRLVAESGKLVKAKQPLIEVEP